MHAATLLAIAAAPAVLAANGPSRLPRRGDAPLKVDLVTPDDPLDDIDDLKVQAKITNVGDKTLTLANEPSSLLSTWKTNSFTLSRKVEPGTHAKATPAKFSGVVVKYDPAKVTRTTLKAGESTTVEHELSGAYDFSNGGAGDWVLEPVHPAFTMVDEATGELKSVTADIIGSNFALSGVGKLVSTEASKIVRTGEKLLTGLLGSLNLDGLTKRAEFSSCSADQQSDIKEAIPAAQSYAKESLSTLQGLTSGDDRYTLWFGEFSKDRLSTVTDHFKKIDGEGLDSFQFSCDCDEQGTFAFVQPDQFGVINLCPAFWDAPTKGEDSKGGTLIHESSHFTKNGATDDHVYGHADAEALAKEDPESAISNADNHEYYAENTGAKAGRRRQHGRHNHHSA